MIGMYKHTELVEFKCEICNRKFKRHDSQSLKSCKNYCSLECEYKSSNNRKHSYELKKSILDFSIINNKFSTRRIAHIFGVSKDVVANVIKQYGNREPKKLLEFNRRYFETIDNEHKAYWLGFIFADGNVRFENKKGSFDICLQYDDIEHLAKFNRSLNSEVTIKKKLVKLYDKYFEACRLSLGSYEFCKDLEDKGCTERKSLTLKFIDYDKIEYQLIKHFIRGYIDGDGYIGNPSENNFSYTIQVLGTKEFLSGILLYFNEENLLTKKLKLIKKDKRIGNDTNTFFFSICGDDARNVINHCYKDSNVYLDRKYKKVEPLFLRYSPTP